MKNNNLVLAPLAFLLILAGLICISPLSMGQNPPKSARGIVIPADLNKVFTRSCMPCHSDRGKEMTKALLNFSKWEKYGRRTQVQKSRAICRMIKKVGPSRVLFGSDWPWFDPLPDIQLIENMELADEDKALVLGLNAKKIYSL